MFGSVLLLVREIIGVAPSKCSTTITSKLLRWRMLSRLLILSNKIFVLDSDWLIYFDDILIILYCIFCSILLICCLCCVLLYLCTLFLLLYFGSGIAWSWYWSGDLVSSSHFVTVCTILSSAHTKRVLPLWDVGIVGLYCSQYCIILQGVPKKSWL